VLHECTGADMVHTAGGELTWRSVDPLMIHLGQQIVRRIGEQTMVTRYLAKPALASGPSDRYFGIDYFNNSKAWASKLNP